MQKVTPLHQLGSPSVKQIVGFLISKKFGRPSESASTESMFSGSPSVVERNAGCQRWNKSSWTAPGEENGREYSLVFYVSTLTGLPRDDELCKETGEENLKCLKVKALLLPKREKRDALESRV